jgi:transaldolase
VALFVDSSDSSEIKGLFAWDAFSGVTTNLASMGHDAGPVIEAARRALDRERLPARIMVGSIRHLMELTEAREAGAHVVDEAWRKRSGPR